MVDNLTNKTNYYSRLLFRHTCVVILLQESAIDFTEIEEALVLVKQKKQKSIPDPDFLQKVDVEMSKGKYCDRKSGC
jgi:hypothetical protein